MVVVLVVMEVEERLVVVLVEMEVAEVGGSVGGDGGGRCWW